MVIKVNEVTLTYSRKNAIAQYESEDVFCAVKFQIESTDNLDLAVNSWFEFVTTKVDLWSSNKAKPIIRKLEVKDGNGNHIHPSNHGEASKAPSERHPIPSEARSTNPNASPPNGNFKTGDKYVRDPESTASNENDRRVPTDDDTPDLDALRDQYPNFPSITRTNFGYYFTCPVCGGEMYDNRLTKKDKQPDFKCKTSTCRDPGGNPKYTTSIYLDGK